MSGVNESSRRAEWMIGVTNAVDERSGRVDWTSGVDERRG